MAARTKVSMLDIAQVLHTSFDGTVATTVNQGEDEVSVRIRYPEWARSKKSILNEIKIENQSGGLIPLSVVTCLLLPK